MSNLKVEQYVDALGQISYVNVNSEEDFIEIPEAVTDAVPFWYIYSYAARRAPTDAELSNNSYDLSDAEISTLVSGFQSTLSSFQSWVSQRELTEASYGSTSTTVDQAASANVNIELELFRQQSLVGKSSSSWGMSDYLTTNTQLLFAIYTHATLGTDALDTLKSIVNDVESADIQEFIRLIMIAQGNEILAERLLESQSALSLMNELLKPLDDMVRIYSLKGDSFTFVDDDGDIPGEKAEPVTKLTRQDAYDFVENMDLLETYETAIKNVKGNYENVDFTSVYSALQEINDLLDYYRTQWESNADIDSLEDKISENFLLGVYLKSSGTVDTDKNVSTIVRTAVSATQTATDSIKEEVRSAMYEFEEFYKAASTLAEKLHKLLERVGSKIEGR